MDEAERWLEFGADAFSPHTTLHVVSDSPGVRSTRVPTAGYRVIFVCLYHFMELIIAEVYNPDPCQSRFGSRRSAFQKASVPGACHFQNADGQRVLHAPVEIRGHSWSYMTGLSHAVFRGGMINSRGWDPCLSEMHIFFCMPSVPH